MTALIDTGFMLAVLSVNDSRHKNCRAVVDLEPNPLMPSIVLPELAYMVIRDLGHQAFIRFMHQLLDNSGQLVAATESDLSRATELMEKYLDGRIDLVDCVIVAMAERLNISRILTVDQRDFRILRPNHIPAFEILP
jgi:uncharacterized protein